MKNKYWEIMERSWEQEPEERMTIEEIENEILCLHIQYTDLS